MLTTRDLNPSSQPSPEQERPQQQRPLVTLDQPSTSAQQPGVQAPGCFLTGPEVSRVGMRMPEFTPADPELWFSIVDRSFQAAGITIDATKFGYALTAIGPRYSTEVRDIIMNPPNERAYETLKTELIKRLSLSQEHKTRRLLEHEEIGDRKPSQFLRHLRTLAGSVVGDQVLRTIWLSRLPTYIQPHLVTRHADTNDQLADIADAIVEATRAPTFQVAETARTPVIQNANDTSAIEARMEVKFAQLQLALQQEMTEKLSALQRSIEAIGEGRSRRENRGREGAFRTRSRSRSRSRSRGHVSNGLCWFHWRFGPDARRCEPPCSAQQQGNAGASR
ncbi:PREDICTED: uncharacterized protein LOC105462772 [Wasmannia auropunctata]|uniref:uncharacterized protein LOC105462772 n=1 Tax=Wasmannia auropunctata TaxID=64793 RepID=UPI0005ED5031|nr:PREDICTED: uncharacterized protein LOC105462772 [Wasmannia auropunctata]